MEEISYSNVEQYLKTLLDFLKAANGIYDEAGEDPTDEHSVNIYGPLKESLRLMKISGEYRIMINDSNGETFIDLNGSPSLEELLKDITFPISEVSYDFGIHQVAFRKFDPRTSNPNKLSIEIINVNIDVNEAKSLAIGNGYISVIQACFKDYIFKQFLGKGTYGSVFRVCRNEPRGNSSTKNNLVERSTKNSLTGNGLIENCSYTIKIIMLGGENLDQIPADFIRETNLIKELSRNGVGPIFYDAWVCKPSIGYPFGCVITELWDGELLPTDCLPDDLIVKLEIQINTIHDLGYIHGDIFTKNILVKRDSRKNVTDVTLNDFGTVATVENWRNIMMSDGGNRFYNGNYMLSPINRNYFIDNELELDDVINDPKILDYAVLYYLRELCK